MMGGWIEFTNAAREMATISNVLCKSEGSQTTKESKEERITERLLPERKGEERLASRMKEMVNCPPDEDASP